MISDLITLLWLLLTLFCALCIHARDGRLANIEAERDGLVLALADVRSERDEARQLVAIKDRQLGGHIKDMTTLLFLAREMGRDDEADDVVRQVEEWLEGR